jgi:pimeloyl-ACP methyl ester carboxylesterase
MLHGNGGGHTRFLPFLKLLQEKEPVPFRVHLPELPGFDGRPLPEGETGWAVFIRPLQDIVAPLAGEDWVVYGHGIGGSLLLEWAARGWALPGDLKWQPKQVVLHGLIGASLEQRFFPKLMRPMLIRKAMQSLIAWPPMRPVWEKRLFLRPQSIPEHVRRQFFRDYAHCAAFPVFFDLITPDWYRQVQEQLKMAAFNFLWGSKERVVASRYLELWQKDFPNATFEIVEGWDHFPMLEDAGAFYEKLTAIIAHEQAESA